MQNGQGQGGTRGSALRSDLPRSAYERIIDEWVFSERDRAILKRRLLDGITFDRLADEFDISPRRVKSIVAAGVKTISKHF